MTTTTTLLHAEYQHPSTLYPVVEDLTELEYGCCQCDENNTMLGRFPLRDIAFPLSQALDMHNQKPEQAKGHRRSSSASSSTHKRRSSQDSSFDDEMTINTDNEETVAKFDASFVLTRQVRIWGNIFLSQHLQRIYTCVEKRHHTVHSPYPLTFADFQLHTIASMGMRPQGDWIEEMR